MRRGLRVALLGVVWLVAAGVAAALLLPAVALFALRAAPGEASIRVALGPYGVSLGTSSLLRVATHPLGMSLLDGRSIETRHGRVQARRGADGVSLLLRCAPCSVDARQLAARPVRVEGIELVVARGDADRLRGELRVDGVRVEWRARIEAQSVQVEARLPDTPVADLVALLGPAVPEAARARIEGTAGATVRLSLPSGRFRIEPRLAGVRVDGLGTESLRAATPLPSCARPVRGRSAQPFGTWLPRAVVAAEDQRFHEHPGYDLAEMAAAWSGDAEAPGAAPPRPRGASTLSQQLAKLLYVGDERSVARKVREGLYAVELDRTLGKARVLQLYLAVAPWGDGTCGAEAAAWQHLGKPAAELDAPEALWLASLLRNPQVELERSARGIDIQRLAMLADALRPLGRARRAALREQLERWPGPPAAQARQPPTATSAHP